MNINKIYDNSSAIGVNNTGQVIRLKLEQGCLLNQI